MRKFEWGMFCFWYAYVLVTLLKSSEVHIGFCGGMMSLIHFACLGCPAIFLQMIMNFSWRQRLHFLLMLLEGLHFFKTFHFIWNSFLASCKVQTCFESSVSFVLLECRKDVWWFLKRSLKFLPLQVSGCCIGVFADERVSLLYIYTQWKWLLF